MIELYTALISQLRNLWQYICIGVTLLFFNYYQLDNKYMIGCIFISLSAAKALENITNKIKTKYITYKAKGYYIKEYKALNKSEKRIIDDCLNRNSLTFCRNFADFGEEESLLTSLEIKKIGTKHRQLFAMNKLCFDTLLEYREKNKDKKNG